MTAAALALGGCGSSPADPIGRVRLLDLSPADNAVVREDTATVRGLVSPAQAQVLVNGEVVGHSGASFETDVPLEDGVTIIDIVGEMPRRAPAVAAIRIRRPVTVEIPIVKGDPPDDAVRELKALGLRPSIRRTGGIIDDLFGGRLRVCGTEPEAGSTVDVQSAVTVEVGRRC